VRAEVEEEQAERVRIAEGRASAAEKRAELAENQAEERVTKIQREIEDRV